MPPDDDAEREILKNKYKKDDSEIAVLIQEYNDLREKFNADLNELRDATTSLDRSFRSLREARGNSEDAKRKQLPEEAKGWDLQIVKLTGDNVMAQKKFDDLHRKALKDVDEIKAKCKEIGDRQADFNSTDFQIQVYDAEAGLKIPSAKAAR